MALRRRAELAMAAKALQLQGYLLKADGRIEMDVPDEALAPAPGDAPHVTCAKVLVRTSFVPSSLSPCS